MKCYNVDNLNHWVNCRTNGVLIRIAHCITSNCSFMGLGPFTTKVTILNVFFRIIPRVNSAFSDLEDKSPMGGGTTDRGRLVS